MVEKKTQRSATACVSEGRNPNTDTHNHLQEEFEQSSLLQWVQGLRKRPSQLIPREVRSRTHLVRAVVRSNREQQHDLVPRVATGPRARLRRSEEGSARRRDEEGWGRTASGADPPSPERKRKASICSLEVANPQARLKTAIMGSARQRSERGRHLTQVDHVRALKDDGTAVKL